MLKAYKYRIYPNNEQKIQIAKTFGSFCTLGICVFSIFATSHQIGLVRQNKNNKVTQTSERTKHLAAAVLFITIHWHIEKKNMKKRKNLPVKQTVIITATGS